jgi:gas vesicle protein
MGNFLLGFGIGVTVGVLFAPKSGSDTRQYLADKANEGGDYLMQQGQQLKDSASDLLDRGRNVVMSQKDKMSEMAGNAAQSFQHGQQGQQFQR